MIYHVLHYIAIIIKLRHIPIQNITIQIRYNAYLVKFPTDGVLTICGLCLLQYNKKSGDISY